MPDRPDIADWLTALGSEFAAYAPAFRANDVTVDLLAMLTAEDLREMGVASVGHRRVILSAASAPIPAAEQAERRLLTIMFCDLVGSTALAAATAAEDYVDFIAHLRAELEATITPFGGTVVQFLGDGIMVCFGHPVASDHDAERAVAAGLAVLETAARLPAPANQPPVQLRIGIATGMAVIGTSPGARDISAIGQTPNLAARLQSIADPGALVISDATRALIGGVFLCDDLGTPNLKGIGEAERVWRVRGAAPVISRFDALRRNGTEAAFVGRGPELAHLVGHLQSGLPLIVTGEAGIGKSRLCRQALGQQGLTPLLLQCSPYNSGVALHPLRYLLIQRCAIGLPGSPDATQALTDLLSQHGLHSPEALALLARFLEVDSPEPLLDRKSSPDLRGDTLRLLTALVSAMTKAARALMIEDAHWLDPSTCEVLTGLLPALQQAGLPVLATARTGEVPADLATLPVLPLDRLPQAEVATLVQAMAGGRTLSPDAVQIIAQRSDGVPIYAEELARGYLETVQGDQRDDPLAQVPMSLAESILARLDRLVHGRRIASLAAAIGREFPLAALVAVCDLPASVVQSGVRELLQAEILVPGQSRFGEAIRFRHGLVRDAAYELLLMRQRAPLHARIATTLETRFPEIAQHLPHVIATQHALAGQHEPASLQWEQAGRAADIRSAYTEAAAFYANALTENAQTDATEARDRREMALRLLRIGALICAEGYQSPAVSAENALILPLSHQLGDADAHLNTLQARWVMFGSANETRAAMEFALQALEATRNGSEVNRLMALRMCATSYLFMGHLPEAEQHYRAFLALYDGDRHAEAMRKGHSNHAVMIEMGLAESLLLMGQTAEADQWRNRCLTNAEDSGRLHDRCHTLVFAGLLHAVILDRPEEVRTYLARLEQVLQGHDLPNWQGYLVLFSGHLAASEGRIHEGIALARRGYEALTAARAFGNWWHLLFADLCLTGANWPEAANALSQAGMIAAKGDQRFDAERMRLLSRLAHLRDGDQVKAAQWVETARQLARRQQAMHLLTRLGLAPETAIS